MDTLRVKPSFLQKFQVYHWSIVERFKLNYKEVALTAGLDVWPRFKIDRRDLMLKKI